MNNQEIERKYLLRDSSFRSLATAVQHIRQGYLCLDPDRTIRIRCKDDKAFITVKGRNAKGGIARFEWEKPLSQVDADALFPLCVGGLVDKERYLVPWDGLTVEVDVFHGANEGLVMAEIELPDEHTPVPDIPFLGEEVTADSRYYNSYLSSHPYTTWNT